MLGGLTTSKDQDQAHPQGFPGGGAPSVSVDDDRLIDGDGDVTTLFFIVWIASLVRVLGAVVRSETFGTEPTLALLFVAVLPALLLETWKGRGRRHATRPPPIHPCPIKKV